MTADVELLPCGVEHELRADAAIIRSWTDVANGPINREALADRLDRYANAAAELTAEIEALRAEVAEAREFRDKLAKAIGNDQLRRFIEKHGEPVPLTIRMQEAEARAERLAEALRRAHRWGGLGKGWGSGVALDLIAWIESGMHGELPPLPDYLAAALAQEDRNG